METGVLRLAAMIYYPSVNDKSLSRADREQNVRGPAHAGVERVVGDEDIRGPVARVVVQEGTAAGELVLEVREPSAARAGIDVVGAAHREREAVSRGQHDRGRPQ